MLIGKELKKVKSNIILLEIIVCSSENNYIAFIKLNYVSIKSHT